MGSQRRLLYAGLQLSRRWLMQHHNRQLNTSAALLSRAVMLAERILDRVEIGRGAPTSIALAGLSQATRKAPRKRGSYSIPNGREQVRGRPGCAGSTASAHP